MNAMHSSTDCGPSFFSVLFIVAFVYMGLCSMLFCAETDLSEPLARVMWLVQVSHHSKTPPNGFLNCIV